MEKTIEARLDHLQLYAICEEDTGLTWAGGRLVSATNQLATERAAIIADWNAAAEAMKHTRNNLAALIEQSDGLAGYHLNGAVAKWDYFEEDDWLGLEQLQRTIAQMEGHSHSRDEAMVEDKRYEKDDIFKK